MCRGLVGYLSGKLNKNALLSLQETVISQEGSTPQKIQVVTSPQPEPGPEAMGGRAQGMMRRKPRKAEGINKARAPDTSSWGESDNAFILQSLWFPSASYPASDPEFILKAYKEGTEEGGWRGATEGLQAGGRPF